jgi:hypothetical protein
MDNLAIRFTNTVGVLLGQLASLQQKVPITLSLAHIFNDRTAVVIERWRWV